MPNMKAYYQGQLDFFCSIYAYINVLKLHYGINLHHGRQILAQVLEEVSAYPRLWNALLRNDSDFYWLTDYMLGRFSLYDAWRLNTCKLCDMDVGIARNAAAHDLAGLMNLQKPPVLDLAGAEAGSLYFDPRSFSLERDMSLPKGAVWSVKTLWPLLQDWLPSAGLFKSLRDKAGRTRKRSVILRFHRFIMGQPRPLISHWTVAHEFNRSTLALFDCTASTDAIHALPEKECALDLEGIGQEVHLGVEPESVIFLESA